MEDYRNDLLQGFNLVDKWNEIKREKQCLTWCEGSGSFCLQFSLYS